MFLPSIEYTRLRILFRETAVLATFLATTTLKCIEFKGFFSNLTLKKDEFKDPPFFITFSKSSRLILQLFGIIVSSLDASLKQWVSCAPYVGERVRLSFQTWS